MNLIICVLIFQKIIIYIMQYNTRFLYEYQNIKKCKSSKQSGTTGSTLTPNWNVEFIVQVTASIEISIQLHDQVLFNSIDNWWHYQITIINPAWLLTLCNWIYISKLVLSPLITVQCFKETINTAYIFLNVATLWVWRL